MANETSQQNPHGVLQIPGIHLMLFLVGGSSIGAGLIALYSGFGVSDGAGGRIPLNTDFRLVGYSGLDNITALGSAEFAIPAIVLGVLCLVIANATAWRETGGY